LKALYSIYRIVFILYFHSCTSYSIKGVSILTKFKANSHFYLPAKQYKNLKIPGWVLVAQACNPSYSVGTDQEDLGPKQAQGNSSRSPILKIHNTNTGMVTWLKG
jgi:hypothetical protein